TMKAAFRTAGADGKLGRPEHPTRTATPPDATAADALAAFAAQLIAAHGPVDAVGVAIPGIVDDAAGIAEFSVAPAWTGLPLRALLAERLGLPVALGHDVRLGGLAEGRIGAAAGSRDYLFLALGTGVGGMLCLDGVPRLGPHHRAAELGHVIVEPDGAECGCGQRGCLETLASATGITRLYREATAGAAGPTRRSAASAAVSARNVARRAAAGDARAVAVWSHALDALATALLSAVTVLDLELVVLGGGVAKAGEQLLGPLRERLETRCTFQRPPRLTAAALGDEAAVAGAALHALDLLTSVDPEPKDDFA
ncbi:MAG TPA: ROK family protein, partial [Trebonia sp.]|nr:ROK family protein [Trebonia sp.]